MGDKQELELMDGFRRLCPADRNTILTAVAMAVSAEEAVRREYEHTMKGSGSGANVLDGHGCGKPAA